MKTTATAIREIAKPVDCAYSVPVEMRRAMHSNPEVAIARASLAAMYRETRARNPAMARLLWRRTKAVEQSMVERLFFSQPDVLAAIRRRPL